jgi:hypothetical protein
VHAYLEELDLPEHEVHLDLARLRRSDRRDAEMSDAELAAAARPRGRARSAASTLVEAARCAVQEPEPVDSRRGAPDAGFVEPENRARAPPGRNACCAPRAQSCWRRRACGRADGARRP